MKVTGFKIKQQIKQLDLDKEALAQELASSYIRYPNEVKRTPEQVITDLQKIEENIAVLQTYQARYNQSVFATFEE